MKLSNKQLLLLFDLYWLRFEKPGEQWYELTDYLRDKLVEEGINISYTEDDVMVDNFSVKSMIDDASNV